MTRGPCLPLLLSHSPRLNKPRLFMPARALSVFRAQLSCVRDGCVVLCGAHALDAVAGVVRELLTKALGFEVKKNHFKQNCC